jgi:hypothetical protein
MIFLSLDSTRAVYIHKFPKFIFPLSLSRFFLVHVWYNIGVDSKEWDGAGTTVLILQKR